MLVGQDLKDNAVAILENLYAEIEVGFYQSGGYDQALLDQARRGIDEFVMQVLSADSALNPEYTAMAEFAAELVYFSYNHPSEFAEMFAESAVKWNRDIDIRTALGICHLLAFFGSVCDDHDYCLDPASDTPLLKLIDQVEVPVRSFGPNTLLHVLQEYRSTLVNEPVAAGSLNIGR